MNERPVEYGFLFDVIRKTAPKRILDVGTGQTVIPAIYKSCLIDAVAIDSDKGQIKKNKVVNIIYDNILKSDLPKNSFDMITCISVLEHIKEFDLAIREMAKRLRTGGVLVLTFPFNYKKYVPNSYKMKNCGYKMTGGRLCQIYSMKEVDLWQKNYGLKLINYEYWQIFKGKMWTVGGRLNIPKKCGQEACDLGCFVLKKL